MRLGLRGVWAALTIAILAPGGSAAEERRYEVAFTMDLKLKLVDRKDLATLKGDARFLYAFKPIPSAIEVSIQEVSMRTTGDAAPSSSFRMNRQVFEDERSGKLDVEKYESASPALRAIFDSFAAPLGRIRLDPEGGETSRVILAKTSLVSPASLLDNTRVFHVRFPKDRKTWTAPVVLPIAGGQAARGTLQFEKIETDAPAKPGLVRVRVSGELTAEGKAREAEIQNGLYKVRGEQAFDSELGDWTSGKWHIDASWEMLKEGIQVGTASGVLELELKRTEENAAAPK